MSCPRCRATLYARSYEGLVLDVCFACGGVWFDQDEFLTSLEGDVLSRVALFGNLIPVIGVDALEA
ncbi:MAG: zf-TFIIB domain-containing protein [Deltaproteobacteria bacterium]|nr:zf-TFIIB domain-containing protein [Deltaproteobacteria bacterium]